jgi:hypothetical protein
MEAAQKNLGNYQGTFQNRGRKKVRGRPYYLPGLQDPRRRKDQVWEKTTEFLEIGLGTAKLG